MHYNTDGYDLFTYMTNPDVFAVKNGAIELLTAPGLGVELDEQLIRKEAAAAAAEKPWTNPVFRGPDGSVREW
jgi:galactonate dehydratase